MTAIAKRNALESLAQLAFDAAHDPASRRAYLRAVRRTARRLGWAARAVHNAVLVTLG